MEPRRGIGTRGPRSGASTILNGSITPPLSHHHSHFTPQLGSTPVCHFSHMHLLYALALNTPPTNGLFRAGTVLLFFDSLRA